MARNVLPGWQDVSSCPLGGALQERMQGALQKDRQLRDTARATRESNPGACMPLALVPL